MPQEEIARRLLETQDLVARFGQENERLAAEIGRMRNGGRAAPGDYKGARPPVPIRPSDVEPVRSGRQLLVCLNSAACAVVARNVNPASEFCPQQSFVSGCGRV